MSITLAIDGMGGDQAPQMVVAGLRQAQKLHPNISFLLYGQEELLSKLIPSDDPLRAITQIRHTDEVVTSETTVSTALRSLKKSSMRLAIQAVADGEAQGVVSAGNTGAYMALSKLTLRAIEGIDRPAIAALLPTVRGLCVVLDLGANVEATTENLVQFAFMGSLFARYVLGIEKPSVGLLNVGVEELKGHDKLKMAQLVLKNNPLIENFYGFIEGDDIAFGKTDVVVTDGFTGNIALKAIEGTAKLLSNFLKQEIQKSFLSKVGALLAKSAFSTVKHRLDPHRYNGAPFLGLKGIAVKSHGGTSAYGFSSAINVAVHLIENKVNERLAKDISLLSQHLVQEMENLSLAIEKPTPIKG